MVLIGTQPTRAVRAAAAVAGVPIVEKPLMSDTLLTTIQQMLGDGALVEPGGRDRAAPGSVGDGSGRRSPLPPKIVAPFSAWR